MKRTPLVLGVVVLSAALAVTAGAVALRGDQADPATDQAALARNLDLDQRGASYNRNYSSLAEMLPNARHTAGDPQISDSVVVGTVTDVDQHTGVVDLQMPAEGDIVRLRQQQVPFDSPAAHWRNLRVTLAVSETVGGEAVKTVVIDWGVMGSTGKGEDADAIGRALKALGAIMVFTKARPDNGLGALRTLADPELGVALVDTTGALNFPYYHGSSSPDTPAHPVTFMNGVDTVSKVKAEATKPAWTVRDAGGPVRY